jgi:hypothetical protein
VVELVERGGGLTDRESRLMLDQAVAIGWGGIFLRLTAKQYARLRKWENPSLSAIHLAIFLI